MPVLGSSKRPQPDAGSSETPTQERKSTLTARLSPLLPARVRTGTLGIKRAKGTAAQGGLLARMRVPGTYLADDS